MLPPSGADVTAVHCANAGLCLGLWEQREGGIIRGPGAVGTFIKSGRRGAWVAQSVERPTSAQVTISQAVSSSPASGSVLTAQSLEPASDSVSPSLSDLPPFMLCLSLSQQ